MQTIWPMSFFVVAWCERNIVFCYLVPCHSPKWWTPLRLQAIARRLFIRLHGISSRTCPGSSFVFLNMSCNVEDVGIQFWWYYIWFCLLLDYFWHHCNYEWKTDYLEPNNVVPRVTITIKHRLSNFQFRPSYSSTNFSPTSIQSHVITKCPPNY